MDGMPRLPMINVDFKHAVASGFSEFSLKIKEYILTHYEDDPKKYETALSEMESLRAKLYSFTPDVETVCQAKRYYSQLRLMKSRFPMEDGDPIRIPFSWATKDSDGITCTYEDVNFELACVLYNIGAIHAAIGSGENRIDSDVLILDFLLMP
uniref:BRO1 domain-containing protein n=1 Tax=Syphacia muris TaxID=451379 RepID=A0A0N5A914_9BILA